jgi:hypothetical protein
VLIGVECAYVYSYEEYIYIYEYLRLYYVSKKKKLGFKPYRNNYTMESFETKD